MCGYACCNCGRCRGEKSAHLVALENVPGYCSACNTLNGPSSKLCKNCGEDLAAPPASAVNPSGTDAGS